MHAIVFEPRTSGGGHYFQYAALVATALLDGGTRVTLLCAEDAPDDPSFATEVPAALARGVALDARVPSGLGNAVGARASLRLSRWLLDHLDRERPDRLCIPTADGLLQTLAVHRLAGRGIARRVGRVDALLMNGRAGYPAPPRLALATRASQSLAIASGASHVHFLDPNAARAAGRGRRRTFGVMPEPVEAPLAVSREEARRHLGLDPDHRLTVALGRQDARKGIDILLEAYARAALAPRDRLLIMGSTGPFAEAALEGFAREEGAAERVVRHDGYVDEETLLLGLRAADLVALPYRTPYRSSGLLLRAAINGRMVFTSGLGYLGEMTRRHALGVSAALDDAASVDAALAAALAACERFEPAPSALALARFHNAASFGAVWRGADEGERTVGAYADATDGPSRTTR